VPSSPERNLTRPRALRRSTLGINRKYDILDERSNANVDFAGAVRRISGGRVRGARSLLDEKGRISMGAKTEALARRSRTSPAAVATSRSLANAEWRMVTAEKWTLE